MAQYMADEGLDRMLVQCTPPTTAYANRIARAMRMFFAGTPYGMRKGGQVRTAADMRRGKLLGLVSKPVALSSGMLRVGRCESGGKVTWFLTLGIVSKK